MFTIKQCVLILLLITVCSKARNTPKGSSRQLEEVTTRREFGSGPYYGRESIREQKSAAESSERRQLQSCQEVVVTGTNHPVIGNNGQYFYFDADQWSSMVGAGSSNEWNGATFTVKQSGSVSWEGSVIVWDGHNGVHGRRDPEWTSGPNQWAIGDTIILLECEQPTLCVNENTFDAGYGDCTTYAIGEKNNHWCPYDSLNGLYANQACPECGKCTSNARRELDEVKNTERSTDIEFDGMMFDISFQQRISDAIQRREEHGEKSIRGQKAEESLERRKLQFDWEHTPEYWEDDSGTPCTSHSDCMDFCNWDGTCAACGECNFCHDGIDNTCHNCEPTQQSEPCLDASELWGSCVSDGKPICNGKSDGNCWCHSTCLQGGNCCDDYVPVCVGPEPITWCTNEDTFQSTWGDCSIYAGSFASKDYYCKNDFYHDMLYAYQACPECGNCKSVHTCTDSCNGKSNTGNCWCDEYCTYFGDCCPDYTIECTRRELGQEENTEKNGRRNLAKTKNKRGMAQRLLKM